MKNLIINLLLIVYSTFLAAQADIKYDRVISPEIRKSEDFIQKGVDNQKFTPDELKLILAHKTSLYKMIKKAQKSNGIDSTERYRIQVAQRSFWQIINQLYANDPDNLHAYRH